MDPWRALGVLVLSVVDALVPAVFVGAVAFTLPVYEFAAWRRPLTAAVLAGAVAFAVTIGYGLASAVRRDRPFPVTRAVKWAVQRWPLWWY